MMNREKLTNYILETYNAGQDYPWAKYPDFTVFRHVNNKKWFALIMDIPRNKLGLQGDELLDAVNFKCDTILIGSLREGLALFPHTT